MPTTGRIWAPFQGGVDEAGRGPLAGPLAACALGGEFSSEKEFIQFIQTLQKQGVADSKALSKKRRAQILKALSLDITQLKSGRAFGLGRLRGVVVEISPQKIDELNIHRATLRAFEQAARAMGPPKTHQCLVFDGPWAPQGDGHFSLIKGDSKCPLVGLASIVAKEFRDEAMRAWGRHYPQYGFEKHSGYPTPQHLRALKEFGPSPIHRLSYRPVAQAL